MSFSDDGNVLCHTDELLFAELRPSVHLVIVTEVSQIIEHALHSDFGLVVKLEASINRYIRLFSLTMGRIMPCR